MVMCCVSNDLFGKATVMVTSAVTCTVMRHVISMVTCRKLKS